MSDITSPLDASNIKPKTFEELKALPASGKKCSRCVQREATHTLGMTAAEIGGGRASLVAQIQKTPVCEQCGVELMAVVRKALRL